MSLMTMELMKLWELLAASFLCLTLLTDPTAACSCAPETPQKAYCNTPYVLLALVKDTADIVSHLEREYKISVTKVLKGPKTLKRFHFLHTPLQTSFCGYEHPTHFSDDKYVLSVRRYGNTLSTTSCDFNRKWKDLSDEEKRGFKGEFKNSCD